MAITDDMNTILLVFLTTHTDYPVSRIDNTGDRSQTLHNANFSLENKSVSAKILHYILS